MLVVTALNALLVVVVAVLSILLVVVVIGIDEISAVELVGKQYCFTAVIICAILSMLSATAEEVSGIRADCTFCQQL